MPEWESYTHPEHDSNVHDVENVSQVTIKFLTIPYR